MRITLPLPNNYDFYTTARMVQRGPNDPINIIEDKTWWRTFWNGEIHCLVKIEADEKVNIDVITGRISQERLKTYIEKSLGTDDPLLNYEMRLPNLSFIKNKWGLAVPGYHCLFEGITQIILGQQISVIVANKIRAQFTHAFGETVSYNSKMFKCFPTPQTIAELDIPALRQTGMSQTKSKAIISLAKHFSDKSWHQQLTQANSAGKVRAQLLPLHGIGDWTVDWILLRGFRQFNVIPASDLAVRKAFTRWLKKNELMHIEEVKEYEKKLHPLGGAITYRVLSAYTDRQQQTF